VATSAWSIWRLLIHPHDNTSLTHVAIVCEHVTAQSPSMCSSLPRGIPAQHFYCFLKTSKHNNFFFIHSLFEVKKVSLESSTQGRNYHQHLEDIKFLVIFFLIL